MLFGGGADSLSKVSTSDLRPFRVSDIPPSMRSDHVALPGRGVAAINHTTQYFGNRPAGQRAWMLCPRCDRRCATLYASHSAAPDWKCRLCWNAVYPSTRTRWQRRWERKADALILRTFGSRVDGGYIKPVGMHRRKFNRLMSRISFLSETAWYATGSMRKRLGLENLSPRQIRFTA